jgi:hypothetical protein
MAHAQRDERPDLREIIGAAVNGRKEHDLEEVAALGAATLILPDRALDAPAPTKWSLDRRLAEALWRVKGGHDGRSSGPDASILFAQRLLKHPMFANFGAVPGSPTMRRFAGRVIVEWARDWCPDCGGLSLENPDPHHAARNVHRTKWCETCKPHPGFARVDHPARALALELPKAIYFRHWCRRFDQAHRLLREIEPTIAGPLHSQRRKRSIAR